MARTSRRESWVLVMTVSSVLIAGCNQRAPVFNSELLVAAPSGWTNTAMLQPPGGDLARVDLALPVVVSGTSGAGTVYLDGPAASGGVVVTLNSAPGAITITPPTVTVPEGHVSADFSFSTTTLTIDTDIPVIANTTSRTRSAQLTLWAANPESFLTWVSDRAGFTSQQFGRVTIDRGGRFDANCSGNRVNGTATASSLSRSVRFAAANQRPLVRGVYDNATANQSGHHMQLDIGLSCQYVGRFEVHELEMYVNGDVTNLHVTFEARCPGREGVVRGGYRGINMRRTSTSRLQVCPGGR